MGYPSLSQRKVFLTGVISDLQYRQMVLSQNMMNLCMDQIGLNNRLADDQGNVDLEHNAVSKNNQERQKIIEMQMKELDTQLQAKIKELEAVEKGEEKAIDIDTPKLGGGGR